MKFSTRLIRKGALAHEARIVLQRWDREETVSDNVRIALADNPVGAKSEGWLNEIRSTLISRISEMSSDELPGIVALARSSADYPVWSACLHWHWARTDSLYYAYAVEWLYEQYVQGIYRIRSDDLVPFVREQVRAQKGRSSELSEYGSIRAARDLLRMSTEFGVLSGTVAKEFTSYHLEDDSFLYLVHAMTKESPNAQRMLQSSDWRIFLMDPSDVERELLRMHQFKQVHFEIAGTVAQLTLPCDSPAKYARSIGS